MASTKAPVSKAGVRKPKGGQAKVFGLTTTGTQNSAAVLNSIGGRGADARPAWPAIFKLMQADTGQRFDRGGEGDWQKLAEATIDAKARKHQDPRIMRASGALYKSLTGDRGRGALRRKSRYQLTYGTSVFYARFHQLGKGVPKRELITVDAALARRIVDALERYVSKGELPERLRPGGF
jgi:phage gpG-like protein